MDKYEYRIKTEQMLKLVDQKDYRTAMKIADSIEWRRVKSVSMLCTVSDIYEKNERYEDARDILLIAYGRSPIGRMILYRLAELAVKMEDFEEAIECYEEFAQVAPKDSSQYILQYKICRGQGQPLEKQIEILERYRQVDYREKWAYELAELYHKAGMSDRCVEICDDLILWFSEGEYVIKAMELKMNYKPLSPMQQKKYDKRNEYLKLSQAVSEKLDEPGTEVLEELHESEQQKADDEFRKAVGKLEEHTYDEEMPDPSTTADIERILQGHEVDLDDMPVAEEKEKPTGLFGRLFGRRGQSEDDYDELDPWEEDEEPEPAPAPVDVAAQDMEIEPVQVNVGPYDTMNLQKELAKNMAQLLESKESGRAKVKEQTREMQEVEEALRELGATADVAEMLKEVVAYEKEEASVAAEYKKEAVQRKNESQSEEPEPVVRKPESDWRESEPVVRKPESDWRESEPVVRKPEPEPVAKNPVFDETLAEEVDGQISLFIPEQPEVEKQITGQLTLDEILEEWEKTKKATEEAIVQAEKKQQQERLKRQETGDIYNKLGDVIPTVPDDVQQLMKELEEELKGSGMLSTGTAADETEPHPMQRRSETEPEWREPEPENLEDTKEFETPSQLFTTKEFTRPGMTGAVPDLSEALYNRTFSQPEDGIAKSEPEWYEPEPMKAEPEWHEPEPMKSEPEWHESEPMKSEPEWHESEPMKSEPEWHESEPMKAEPEWHEPEPMKAEPEWHEPEPMEAEPEWHEPEPEEADLQLEQTRMLTEEDCHSESEAVKPEAEWRESETVLSEPESEEAEPGRSEPEPMNSESQLEETRMFSQEELVPESETLKEELRNPDDLEETRVLKDTDEEEQESGPRLTEAQKKLFSYFVPVKGMSEQLANVLEADKTCTTRHGTSSTGNILLVGRSGSGKTVLAINLVKAIQHARRMRTGKLAKISAASLNKKLVREVLSKLHGGSLIIEKAGDLADDTVRDLNRYMEGRTDELLVILEDERKPLERMLRLNPNFAKKFTSRVEVPIFINDELVTFGKAYAREQGCMIDDMGILALYTRIDEQQREDHAVTVAEVKDIIDEAIEHATNSGMKKIVSVFRKHQDESEIILKEHDFGI